MKPTNNTNSAKYDPKSKNMKNSGNVVISLLAASYSTLTSLWGDNSKKDKKGKNRRTLDSTNQNSTNKSHGSNQSSHQNSPSMTKAEKRHSKNANTDQIRDRKTNKNRGNNGNSRDNENGRTDGEWEGNVDEEGNIPRNGSECSLDSINSMSSNDSDVIVMKSPLLLAPKWLNWTSVSNNIQSYVFTTNTGTKTSKNTKSKSKSSHSDKLNIKNDDSAENGSLRNDLDGNGGTEIDSDRNNDENENERRYPESNANLSDPYFEQRKELWDKVSNNSIIVAQNVGTLAFFSISWVVRTTGTGAAVILDHLWSKINTSIQKYVDDATAAATRIEEEKGVEITENGYRLNAETANTESTNIEPVNIEAVITFPEIPLPTIEQKISADSNTTEISKIEENREFLTPGSPDIETV